MPTDRLLIDSVVAVILAAVLGVIGFLAAEPLLRAAYESLGTQQVTVTSPYELAVSFASIAVAFALPSFAAWLAALIERALAKEVPSFGRLALYWLVPAGCVAAALAGRLWLIALLARELDALSPEGIEPVVTVGSIGLGSSAITWGATLSVVMWIVVAVVASRRKHRV